MEAKDKWINNIEKSIEGIERPAQDPYLYNKVVNRLQSRLTDSVPAKIVWVSGLAFVVLVLLNLLIFKNSRTEAEPGNDIKQLSGALKLMNENTITYN